MDNILDEILAVERLLDPYPGADREIVIAQKCLSAGRKEVVEWMKKYRSESTRDFVCLTFFKANWEAQLKVWGIE